jgi:hypothetical protein
MGIIDELAASHAGSFMASASADMGDPRMSRMNLLSLANQITSAVQSSAALRDAVFRLEDSLHNQLVSRSVLHKAAGVGWPNIDGVQPSAANLIYALGRLNAHNALAAAPSEDVPSSVELRWRSGEH